MQTEISRLLEQAKTAAAAAYVPYSQQAKGAALEALDGSIYTGASVEFATYGGSVCAELAALACAVGAGKRQFKMLALYPQRLPCGHCRQFYREFGLELEVVTANKDGTLQHLTLSDLLPDSFGPDSLA